MTDEPWVDPIVEEVRRARHEYAARFGYDLEAILCDLRDEQEQARREGRTIVPAPPRPDQSAEPAA